MTPSDKPQSLQASEEVVALAGGAYEASMNLIDSGGGCMVATVQVDQWVLVVGQDDFSVCRYTLAEWLGETDQSDPVSIESDDAVQALELLEFMRQGTYLWQCGSCADGSRGWIHTSHRPRIGVLACSCCGREGGVDFRHADRHVGGDH